MLLLTLYCLQLLLSRVGGEVENFLLCHMTLGVLKVNEKTLKKYNKIQEKYQ